MNTEQERTEFEAWYRLHHGSLDGYGRIERLRYEADISDRPGQFDRLHALADEFAAAWDAALNAAITNQATLTRAARLFEEALPKFNWGASALDANAIQLLNEVPGEVRAALKACALCGGEGHTAPNCPWAKENQHVG